MNFVVACMGNGMLFVLLQYIVYSTCIYFKFKVKNDRAYFWCSKLVDYSKLAYFYLKIAFLK